MSSDPDSKNYIPKADPRCPIFSSNKYTVNFLQPTKCGTSKHRFSGKSIECKDKCCWRNMTYCRGANAQVIGFNQCLSDRNCQDYKLSENELIHGKKEWGESMPGYGSKTCTSWWPWSKKTITCYAWLNY